MCYLSYFKPNMVMIGTSHPVTGDRRTATSRGLTGWWATGVPDSPAQRWVIGPRRVFCTHSVPVTASPPPTFYFLLLRIRGAAGATPRVGSDGRVVWAAGFVSPATCPRLPCPHTAALPRRVPRHSSLDPFQPGSGAPPAIFITLINRGLIGSDRLPSPRL